MQGLFAWIGFRQVAVPYERGPRLAGETKWNYWKLLNLSIEGITSFSVPDLIFLVVMVCILAQGSGDYEITRIP